MKKIEAFLLILFLAFSFFPSCLLASPPEDEDFSAWILTDLEHKFNDKWKMKLGKETRFREHAGISYFDTHIGAGYQTHPRLLLGADYIQARQTRTQGKKDLWYWESRPRVYATLQPKIRGFLFENRHMLETRFKQDTEDTLRYRFQTALTAPWKWTPLEIQPYVSNEIFLESNRNGLIQDRLIGGFRYKINQKISASLFYLRQFSKNNSAIWKDLNVLGTNFKLSL